jgi:predicted transcriptional regulator
MSVPTDADRWPEALEALVLNEKIDPHSKVLFMILALREGAQTAEDLRAPAMLGRQQVAQHLRRWVARGVVVRSKRANYATERFEVTYQMAKPLAELDADDWAPAEVDGADTE